MSKLVRALVASSGADLQLASRVTQIKKLNANEYEVSYTSGGVDIKTVADAVVIAAPFEWTGVQVYKMATTFLSTLTLKVYISDRLQPTL